MDLMLIFLVVGTWTAFVIFGLAQEGLTRTEFGDEKETFKFTTFLVLLQSCGNAVVAAVLLLLVSLSSGKPLSLGARVPLKDWIVVALAYAGAHKFGLWSLLYIPFPLQVLLKSCKTIPVMVGELLLDTSKKPSPQKITSVLVLTVGIGAFMFFKKAKKGGGSFEYNEMFAVGIGLVVLALICDAVYGPYQGRIIGEAKAAGRDPPTSHHLMFNMNFYQGVIACLMLAGHMSFDIAVGGMAPGEAFAHSEVSGVLAFIKRHPEILPVMLQFSLAMAFGNLFIYQLQRDYGALVVTTATTVRKFLSVLASSLPKEGVCAYLPLLPQGLCGLAALPGCGILSCASLSGFGNEVAPLQWLGVAIVVLCSQISKLICSAAGLDAPKYLLHKYQKDYLKTYAVANGLTDGHGGADETKALDALVGMATKSRKKVFEDVQCRHCGSQNPAPWIADNKDKAAYAFTLSPASAKFLNEAPIYTCKVAGTASWPDAPEGTPKFTKALETAEQKTDASKAARCVVSWAIKEFGAEGKAKGK